MREFAEAGWDGANTWMPAEADVSMRPGWYWTAETNDKVKSIDQLMDIYYHSVGYNTNLILNIAVDRRGFIGETDEAALRGMAKVLGERFATDLARGAVITGSDTRRRVGVRGASLTVVSDDGPKTFDQVFLQAPIELGPRVCPWNLVGRFVLNWKRLATGRTIGRKRIARFDRVSNFDALRLNIVDGGAGPTIETLSIFNSAIA